MSTTAAVPPMRRILGAPLPPHARSALAELADDATIEHRALAAWDAHANHLAQQAARTLSKKFKEAFGLEIEARFDFFQKLDPKECPGLVHDGYIFAFRTHEHQRSPGLVWIAATCADKDCETEFAPSVADFITLGRAIARANEEGVGPEWKCRLHRKGNR